MLLTAAMPVGCATAQADVSGALGPSTDAACVRTCGDTVCGWAEDCFCAFCDAGRACIDGHCRALPRFVDPHEPDDDPVRAHAVPWPDAPGADVEIPGGIGADDPIDWLAITRTDGEGTRWPLEATLSWPARDRDLDLAVCHRCDRGDPADPTGPETDALVELDAPIPGARCFASMRPWGRDERIVLEPGCDANAEAGRVATVWIAVWPAAEHDAGTPYRLVIRVGGPPASPRPPSSMTGRSAAIGEAGESEIPGSGSEAERGTGGIAGKRAASSRTRR